MNDFWVIIAVIVVIGVLIRAKGRGSKETEVSKSKLKIARKTHKTDFGTYPDDSAKFEDTNIETPLGTFICYHDGTFSDLTNDLMWIQAPWGMEWNGKKFKGEPIKLSWHDSTKLFGFGGTLPKMTDLRKENIETYGYKKYKRGSCVVTFSGYSDWRLPTAKELLTLSFSDSKKFNAESGYSYDCSEKSQQLYEQLFPDCPHSAGSIFLWSANDNGWEAAWGNDRKNSLADVQRIRLDCVSETNHNLNRLLDKPGSWHNHC